MYLGMIEKRSSYTFSKVQFNTKYTRGRFVNLKNNYHTCFSKKKTELTNVELISRKVSKKYINEQNQVQKYNIVKISSATPQTKT